MCIVHEFYSRFKLIVFFMDYHFHFFFSAPFTFPPLQRRPFDTLSAVYCCANKQRSGVKLKINEPKVVSG